jgi:hypothetical protein
VRRAHELDRQLEQRAQRVEDLLTPNAPFGNCTLARHDGQPAVNCAASSEPRVASPALYECAPAPASCPPATIRYSSRIGRPSNQHSRISRTPAA